MAFEKHSTRNNSPHFYCNGNDIIILSLRHGYQPPPRHYHGSDTINSRLYTISNKGGLGVFVQLRRRLQNTNKNSKLCSSPNKAKCGLSQRRSAHFRNSNAKRSGGHIREGTRWVVRKSGGNIIATTKLRSTMRKNGAYHVNFFCWIVRSRRPISVPSAPYPSELQRTQYDIRRSLLTGGIKEN